MEHQWKEQQQRKVQKVVNILYRFLKSSSYDNNNKSPPIELLFLILRLSYHHKNKNKILNSKWYKENLIKRVRQMSRLSYSVYNKQDRMFHIETFEKILMSHNINNNESDNNTLTWLQNLQTELQNSISSKPSPSTVQNQPTINTARNIEKCNKTNINNYISLSKHEIWQKNIEYYSKVGIEAWSSNTVPFGISSNTYIANIYLERILYFIRHHKSSRRHNHSNNTHEKNESLLKKKRKKRYENDDNKKNDDFFYIIELGAGHGKLSYLICKFLCDNIAKMNNNNNNSNEFKFNFQFIVTDVALNVVENHAINSSYFKPYIDKGLIDFAVMPSDTSSFNGLNLLCSKQRVELNSIKDQVILLSNYFFDSLPIDLYRWVRCDNNITGYRLEEILVNKKYRLKGKIKYVTRPIENNDAFPSLVQQHIEKYKSILLNNSNRKYAYFSVPVGSFQYVDMIKMLLSDDDGNANNKSLFWIYGDKVHNSYDDTVLKLLQNGGKKTINDDGSISGELPSLIQHGDQLNGCISVTVDWQLICHYILGEDSHNNNNNNNNNTNKYRNNCEILGTTNAFQIIQVMPPNNSNKNKSSTITTDGIFNHYLSVTDWDELLNFFINEIPFDFFSFEEIFDIIEFSHYDFDVFADMQWDIYNKWKKQLQKHLSTKSEKQQIIEWGLKCYGNRYFLYDEERNKMIIQFYRWLYLFEEYKICEDMLLPFIDLFSLHDALMQRNVYILYASCALNDMGDSLKVKKEKMLYLIEKVKDKKLLGRLNGMLKRMVVGAKTN